MPLILKPDPTDKTPNHFIVLCDGVQVGRIFDRVPGASAPHDATWYWTIDGNYRRDYSRALAYGFGGDRNGWSVTKMLRIATSTSI